jgi:hypothetical protein
MTRNGSFSRMVQAASVTLAFLYLTIGMAGCGGGSSAPISVAVTSAAATVDPADATTLTATVSNDKNSAGVTWSVSGGGTLSNTTTTSATYTAPANSTAALTITITATSVADTTKSGTTTLTVPVAPSITTTTLAAGAVGTAYSATLAGSGGISPYTWSVGSGSLPSGLSLAASTGVISGTPLAAGAGASNITFKLTDSGAATALTATKALNLTVSAAHAISFTTASVAAGTYNTAYSATVAATGGAGTLTYSLASGVLPAGLSLSAAGSISGTPTATGTSTFTLKAADAFGDSATKGYSIAVAYPALSITTNPSLPAGIVGGSYSQTLAATGGSGTGYTYAVTTGTVLSAVGLTLSSAGAIAGMPAVAETAGTFTVQVTDSASNKATAQFSLTVYPALSIATVSLPYSVVGTAYTATLAAKGGSGTGYSYTVTSGTGLSATGLSLSAAGTISGAPTATETAIPVTVQVADSAGDKATATFSITIYPSFAITTSSLASGIVGKAYTATIAASGGSGTGYTYTVTSGTGLSAVGLSLSAGGTIAGTPTTTETAGSFSVQVTDSLGEKTSATLSLTIYPVLSIATASIPNGLVGTAYTATLATSGGSGSGYSYTVTSGTGLSAVGLSLSSAGAISGTPTTTETAAPFAVQVTDSAGNKASANLALTIAPAFSITTTSVPSGIVGKAYAATIVASGGSGSGYTYKVTSGTGLSGVGLSLSTAGAITGTPNATETAAAFTVQVTDSASNKTSAQFTLTINPVLSVTTTSVPNGTVGTAYSTTLAASGGTGSGYIWSITSGTSSLSNVGLSLANDGIISGTPTAIESASSFTVKVTDSGGFTASKTFSITVSYATLSITTTSLPGATVGDFYSQNFSATGGSGNYSWLVTVNSAGLAGDNLAMSAGGVLSGTPGSAKSIPFTVQVTDTTTSNTATAPYTLVVGATYSVSGNINLVNNCGGITLPAFEVSINTSPVRTTTTDSNGNFSFSGLPNGTYTLTPSITGASSVFYPATQSVTIASGNSTTGDFNVNLGYTVSGTVAYGGSKTGQIYLALNPTNCGGGGTQGTSISSAGTYAIRGVPPGPYTLNAFMDNLGKGAGNASNPTGSSSVAVATANYTGANVTLADPATVTLSAGPKLNGVIGLNTGIFASYNPIENGSGVEEATSYTLQWSTSSSFASIAGSKTFPANGIKTDVWFTAGLTNGSVYYFRAYGTSAGTALSPYSSTFGPVTIGANTSGSTVSGTVTFTGTATGPMFAGLYNQNTGAFYGDYIANPVSPQAYSVVVPDSTTAVYAPIAVIDQNNDGVIDAGDIQNTNNVSNSALIAVTGTTTGENITFSSAGAVASVQTQNSRFIGSGGTTENYDIAFNVQAMSKQPVAVTLQTNTNSDGANAVAPMDIALCGGVNSSCGNGFQVYVGLSSVSPAVGDTYTFDITYSDGTTGTLMATVTGILTAFPTNLAPTSGTSTTPTFTWTDPVNPGNYTYVFYMNDQNGNVIWSIPGNNSNSNGFSSSITSITWGTDPTGGGSTPTVSSLTLGTRYSWSIQLHDSNDNQATTQVYYQP